MRPPAEVRHNKKINFLGGGWEERDQDSTLLVYCRVFRTGKKMSRTHARQTVPLPPTFNSASNMATLYNSGVVSFSIV